jgi:prepilin-type N-terminal cleavage/methylation domain-containing protein
MIRIPGPAARRGDDSGLTIVELLVAMGIFGVLLAIFSSAMMSLSKATVRTLQRSTQTSESRTIFDLFDKQVRSASAVNSAGLGTSGLNWYVEYKNEIAVPTTCTQWVLRTDTDTLAFRTYTDGAVAGSTWRTVAKDVVNTTTQPPFALTVSSAAIPMQRLSLNLRFQKGKGPLSLSNSVFTARNTSTATDSNSATTQVCQFSGWRP